MNKPELTTNGQLQSDMQSQLMEIVAAKQAAKERGEFQVEVPPPDKFNQALEEFLANKANDSDGTPVTSTLRNSDGTGRKMVDDFSRTHRWGVK